MEDNKTNITQNIYNNHFAYNLLKTLSNEDNNNIKSDIKESKSKPNSLHYYTSYGEDELSLLSSYIDYTNYIITSDGKDHVYNEGFVCVVGGTTKEVLHQIDEELKSFKANALIDLANKVTSNANGLTPNFSKIFIMADIKDENDLNNLIGLASAKSYCKDLLVYCKNFVRECDGEHFLVSTQPFYEDYEFNVDQYTRSINADIIKKCEQKAEDAVKKYQKKNEDGSGFIK